MYLPVHHEKPEFNPTSNLEGNRNNLAFRNTMDSSITPNNNSRGDRLHEQLKREFAGESSNEACNLQPNDSLSISDAMRTKAFLKEEELKTSHDLPTHSSSYAISNLSEEYSEHKTVPEVELPPLPTNFPMAKPFTGNPYVKDGFTVAAAIESLLTAPKTTLSQPILRFDINKEAAISNLKLLRDNNYDLTKLCNFHERSSTTYGSEFKTAEMLDKLFYLHPRWTKLRSQLTSGVEFDLEELDEKIRIQDLRCAVARGNHKSASKNEEFLEKAMKKEIMKGWNLILPGDCFEEIPELILNPMGVATHLGINEEGKFLPKNRVTHDLSFLGEISRTSVNSRVKTKNLEPCMFSFVLLRVIHYIVALRRKYPNRKIWLRKEDFKSAFRRLHLNAKTALRSAVRVKIGGEWYIVVSLRMPFGGSPCPSEFAVVADLVTDTINDLLEDQFWDHSSVCSPNCSKVPKPVPLPENIPYAKARELSVEIPLESKSKADVFVDDVITVGLDTEDNLERITKAPITVLDAIADDSILNCDILRDDLLADDKTKIEGAPEEIKICLGWTLNTRSLLVSLPDHKKIGWLEQIEGLLNQKTVGGKELSSILGRLENVAQIVTMFGHFLSNIRSLEILANVKKHNVRINRIVKEDLKLAQSFIIRANQGISLNLLTFRKPDVVYICDASEYGLGGFATHGRAWSYQIPLEFRNRAHINVLEYISQIVAIWIDIVEGNISREDCVLSIGDNTSAMGWLRRSNFRQKEDSDTSWFVKQQLGRHLADLVLKADICLYQQWLKGSDNLVADSLSRDNYYMKEDTHKSFLNSVVPHQLPPNFSIRPVPREICCFITSILQQLPATQLQSSIPKPSELALGNIGTLSCIVSESVMSSLMVHPDFRRISSCQDLPKPSGKGPSLKEIIGIWLKEQSQPPSHMWLRPSGQTTGKIPDWTMMEKLALYYKNSTEDIAIKTREKENKRHYQC